MKLTPINEFAKIIPASNGQHVLFWWEPEPQGKSILHRVARWDEVSIQTNETFQKTDAAKEAFDKADTAAADAVLKEMTGLLSPV